MAADGGAKPEREGSKFRMPCAFHSERTGSMVLYPDQRTFHCFGCGAHGDILKLVEKQQGCDFLGAVRWLARFSGYWPEGLTNETGIVMAKAVPASLPPSRIKEDKRKKLQVITPVPAKVPAISLGTFETFLHEAHQHLRPTAMWPYLDGASQLLGVDVRYDYTKTMTGADGQTIIIKKKAPITWTWCRHLETGEESWQQKSWPDPSPLFGLDQLAARPDADVLVCEGCKAATAGAKRTGLVAVTWRGGASSAINRGKNDWSALTGRRVFIWPDADEPGLTAAWHIAQHLHAVQAASVRVVDVSELMAVKSGWDLADD